MKAQMKAALCAQFKLDPNKELKATCMWQEERLAAIVITDGKITFHISLGTQEFLIAKTLFNIDERIRKPNFTYKIEG